MNASARSRALAAALAAAAAALLPACDPGSPRVCTVFCGDLDRCPDGTSCGSDNYCHGPDEAPGSCSGATPDAAVGEPDGAIGEPDGGRPDAAIDEPDGCSGRDSFAGQNRTAIDIPDADTTGITSAITAGELCAAVSSVQIRIDITHTFRGDLRVQLTSPAGSTVIVLQESTDGTDDIHQVFDVDIAAGEAAAGDWLLTVADVAGTDTGTLAGVTLLIPAVRRLLGRYARGWVERRLAVGAPHVIDIGDDGRPIR